MSTEHGIDALVGSESPPTDLNPCLDFDHFQGYSAQNIFSSHGITASFADSLSTQHVQLAAVDTNNNDLHSPQPNQEQCFPPDQNSKSSPEPSDLTPDATKSPHYIIRLDEANHETILLVMNILMKSKARVRFEAA